MNRVICPDCKEDITKYYYSDKDVLFCPYCGSPITDMLIKEWEIPQIFTFKGGTTQLSPDVKGIIKNLNGKIIGFILANQKCAEIHLGSVVFRINLRIMHPEILVDKHSKPKLELLRKMIE